MGAKMLQGRSTGVVLKFIGTFGENQEEKVCRIIIFFLLSRVSYNSHRICLWRSYGTGRSCLFPRFCSQRHRETLSFLVASYIIIIKK